MKSTSRQAQMDVTTSVLNVRLKREAGLLTPLKYRDYLHKWSTERRPYRPVDLMLPESLHWRSKFAFNPSRIRVAFGGTRSPQVQTFRQASNFARALVAMDVQIISGGVPGVDLAAHMDALSRDCCYASSVAVLANPVAYGLAGHIWNNPFLTQGFLERGGILSEYETYVEPDGPYFRERLLDRDRIISGVSNIFVAFECSIDSATVDTAKRAANQGVITFAVHPPKLSIRTGVQQLVDEGVCTLVTLNDIMAHINKINTIGVSHS